MKLSQKIVNFLDGNSQSTGKIFARYNIGSWLRDLAAEVEGLAGDVEGLAGDVGGLAGDVEGLAGDVGGIDDRIDGIDEMVLALDGLPAAGLYVSEVAVEAINMIGNTVTLDVGRTIDPLISVMARQTDGTLMSISKIVVDNDIITITSDDIGLSDNIVTITAIGEQTYKVFYDDISGLITDSDYTLTGNRRAGDEMVLTLEGVYEFSSVDPPNITDADSNSYPYTVTGNEITWIMPAAYVMVQFTAVAAV